MEFGKNIFSTDGFILYCEICEANVSINNKFRTQQHVRRDKHKNALTKTENNKNVQPFIHQHSNVKSDFTYNLCNGRVAANYKSVDQLTDESHLI